MAANPDKQKILVERAGVLRRIAALIYDSFLIGSIWFAEAGIVVILHKGEAMPVWANQFILLPILIISTFFFYFWFWTHGGQTLGMRAWRLKLVNKSGSAPDFRQCLIRFASAVISAGSGFLTSPFHPEKKSLQDMASDTEVVLLPKQ